MTTLVPGIIFMGRKWGEKRCAAARGGFFIFLFLFFTKIYFRFQNLQEYTPAAPLPGGRVARQRGGRGFYVKNFAQIITRRSLGSGRPGRPGNGVRWRLVLTRLANNASAPHGGTCFFPNCFLCNWRGLGMGRPGTATALVCAGGS